MVKIKNAICLNYLQNELEYNVISEILNNENITIDCIDIKINDSIEKIGFEKVRIEATTRQQEITKDCLKNCLKFVSDYNNSVEKEKKLGVKFINFKFKDFEFVDLKKDKNKNKDLIELADLIENINISYEKCEFDDFKFKYYKFIDLISFKDCKFNKSVNFIDCIFEEEFYFKDCKFIEKDKEEIRANFSNSVFENNAYFNNTEFLGYADFHEAKFEAVACFYGVTFKKPMNFSSAIFKDFNKTDFVNLNIENINLKDIETAVEENYEDESYKKEREKIDNNSEENEKEKKIKELDLKYKIRWANNFRDSFRVIKHSLIETDNNLEASNLHKLELYAKEIGLDYTAELEACKRREKTSTDWNWTAETINLTV